MKFTVFWDVAPCSHVEADRRFRDAYCLHDDHRPDDAVRTSETSVNFNLTTRRYIPDDLTNSVAPEPEGSTPYSQDPAGPYPEPTGSNLYSSSQSPQDPF
jgi:hypothetical protein